MPGRHHDILTATELHFLTHGRWEGNACSGCSIQVGVLHPDLVHNQILTGYISVCPTLKGTPSELGMLTSCRGRSHKHIGSRF
jgi:hypothetical protein